MTQPAHFPKPPDRFANPVRRRERVRQALRRMRERRSEAMPQTLRALSSRGRMRKRRTALALSVGAVGIATTANSLSPKLEAPEAVRAAEKRQHASRMRASDTLKQALIEEEGVRLTVYADPVGKPTVGVGHLVGPGENLRIGDRLSHDDVLDLLDADIAHAEAAVARLVGDLPLFQHEFDALVDLVFNVGEGTLSALRSPRLNQAIDARDYFGMATELDYTRASNRQLAGLEHRSDRRARMFMQGSYENPRGMA